MFLFWLFISLLAYAFVGFLCCLAAPYVVNWYFEGTEKFGDYEDYLLTAVFWPMWIVVGVFAVPFEIAVRQAIRINENSKEKKK
jgi:hypothetical protein